MTRYKRHELSYYKCVYHNWACPIGPMGWPTLLPCALPYTHRHEYHGLKQPPQDVRNHSTPASKDTTVTAGSFSICFSSETLISSS